MNFIGSLFARTIARQDYSSHGASGRSKHEVERKLYEKVNAHAHYYYYVERRSTAYVDIKRAERTGYRTAHYQRSYYKQPGVHYGRGRRSHERCRRVAPNTQSRFVRKRGKNACRNALSKTQYYGEYRLVVK